MPNLRFQDGWGVRAVKKAVKRLKTRKNRPSAGCHRQQPRQAALTIKIIIFSGYLTKIYIFCILAELR
jgi:hypothetical protein